MSGKIYEIGGKLRSPQAPSDPDDWYVQLDVRQERIELLLARLEWQVVLVACGAFAFLATKVVFRRGRVWYSKGLPIWGAPYRETLGIPNAPPLTGNALEVTWTFFSHKSCV